MASSEVDRLVDRIRLQRHRVARAWHHCGVVESVQHSFDRHPIGWVVGGALVGFFALPVLVPALLAAPRRLARLWMRSAIQGGVLHVAQGALVDLWTSRMPEPPAEVTREDAWERAMRPPEEPPLQASGGPVRPMS